MLLSPRRLQLGVLNLCGRWGAIRKRITLSQACRFDRGHWCGALRGTTGWLFDPSTAAVPPGSGLETDEIPWQLHPYCFTGYVRAVGDALGFGTVLGIYIAVFNHPKMQKRLRSTTAVQQ